MCHLSPVTCHNFFLFFFTSKKNWKSGGARRWRVCYQWGLPRLVYSNLCHKFTIWVALRHISYTKLCWLPHYTFSVSASYPNLPIEPKGIEATVGQTPDEKKSKKKTLTYIFLSKKRHYQNNLSISRPRLTDSEEKNNVCWYFPWRLRWQQSNRTVMIKRNESRSKLQQLHKVLVSGSVSFTKHMAWWLWVYHVSLLYFFLYFLIKVKNI